jgi:hypothetical protein
MTLFHMPNELVRDVIGYCVREGVRGQRSDALLKIVVSTVSELRIVDAHIYDGNRGASRYARIVIRAQDVERFESIFPDARRLKNDGPGLAVFRLREGRISNTR